MNEKERNLRIAESIYAQFAWNGQTFREGDCVALLTLSRQIHQLQLTFRFLNCLSYVPILTVKVHRVFPSST